MKRLISTIVVLLMLAVGCFGQLADEWRLQEIAQKNHLPLFGNEDFNKFKPNVETEHTLYEVSSPYFKGKLPFIFRSQELNLGMGMKIVNSFIFDTHIVLFKNDGPKVEGACAIKNDQLMAEARLSYEKQNDGRLIVKAEEFHYNARGELVYYCVSLLTRGSMQKKQETMSIGHKEQEYFIFWPTLF